MPNRELGFWILSVLGGAVAGAVIGGVPMVASNWPWYANLGAGVIISVALGLGPWIALGQHWVWWLVTAIGPSWAPWSACS